MDNCQTNHQKERKLKLTVQTGMTQISRRTRFSLDRQLISKQVNGVVVVFMFIHCIIVY